MTNPSHSSLETQNQYLVEMEKISPTIGNLKMVGPLRFLHQTLTTRLSKSLSWVKNFFNESLEWSFGFITMLVLLAFIAVIPILNFVSLGYLVQMGANIASTGKLTDGLVGIKKSAILGRMALGSWLCFWPVKFVFELKMAAHLTDPGGSQEQFFHLLSIFLLFLTVLHILWACLRGGKFRHFIWPAPLAFYKWLKTPQHFKPLTEKISRYLSEIQFKSYFTLGFKSFLGASIWLAIPVGLLIFTTFLPPAGMVLSIPAGIALMWVVLHLPFLQLHLANQKSFRAVFDIKSIRQVFQKAPLNSWLALFITLLFSIPLYLLKIELTPEEIAWMPSLLFVFFIFPARLLVGWAIFKANRHQDLSARGYRWAAKVAAIPVLLGYVTLIFINQYLSWNGSYSLLEQHAFLVPAPWMGL